MELFDRSSPSKRIWLDRLGTFVLALILALVVWVVATQQENPVVTVLISGVPVKVQHLPDDLAFSDQQPSIPDYVDVRVRGPQGTVNTLAPADFTAVVDLSDAEPGTQDVPIIVKSNVSSVEVLEIYPDAVVVQLVRKVEKEVPVVANLIGEPPFGFIADTPIITPTHVLVRGPEPKVDSVVQVDVSVRLTDAREDVRVTDFVSPRGSNGLVVSGLEIDPQVATVLVPIKQRQGFSEKTVLPKIEGQPATNYRIAGITVEPTTVTLFGDPATLNEMPPFVETVPVDITGATEDIEERVPIVLPEAVAAVGAQAVVVHVQIVAIEGSVTMALNPVIQGLDPELAVESVSPETIDVILQGPLPKLQSLTADVNVQAVLNLSGRNVGVHSVTPVMVVPEGVTVQTILPETVQVTIGIKPTPTPTPTPTPKK
jgi:YbbR domain-containing protein